MYSVLLIGNEPWGLMEIAGAFKWEDFGFYVIKKTVDPSQAMEICLYEHPDVVVLDVPKSGNPVFDLIDEFREKGCNPYVMLVSSATDFLYTKHALQKRVFDYLQKPLDRRECDQVLDRLFNALCRDVRERQDEKNHHVFIENKQFRSIVNYINSNLEKELRLKDLAELFNINPSYCSQLFKRHFGQHFSQYINSLRIDRACFLLMHTDLKLDELSRKSGFNDSSYFMKTFKRIKGCTLNAYRERHRSRPD